MYSELKDHVPILENRIFYVYCILFCKKSCITTATVYALNLCIITIEPFPFSLT